MQARREQMGQAKIQQLMDSAGRHYQAGQFDEAERECRQVLAVEPAHPDALHMLGILRAQRRDFTSAAAMIGRAIEVRPGMAAYYANLGNVLQESGQVEEAIAAYRRAIALAPALAEVHNNLGNALQLKGEVEAALREYEQATALRPDFPEAQFNRGNALQRQQRWKDAIAAYRRALSLRPGYAEAHLQLGMALFGDGEVEPAIAEYRRAIALRGDLVEAYGNLGRALLYQGRPEEAIAEFQRALALRHDQPDIEHELGSALREVGRLDESIAAYQRSLATRSGFADSHFGLAWTYLLKGDFERGWAEYEWRSGLRDAAPWARNFTQPRWDGSDLHGRRILLYAEQGFGDTFLAFRYVPMVVARGGRVLLQCPGPMLELLASQPGIEQAVEDGQPTPPFEVQCPLMSLPGVFGTTLATIPSGQGNPRFTRDGRDNRKLDGCDDLWKGEAPAEPGDSRVEAFGSAGAPPSQVSYIDAQPELVEQWRERLGKSDALQVGLVWSGKPIPRNRSIPFEMLAPFAGIPGVRWHSLQVGEPAAAARTPNAPMQLLDWSARLTDFAQTAALIDNLDLVITIDTAVAHLAGAMGKPVWVMLQSAADWRWLLGRDDSPWYPTMRLFHQPRPGDWAAVIGQVTTELCRLVEKP